MKKKLIAALLLFFIVASGFSVYASVEYSDTFAQDVLKSLDIMKGDENGDMRLSSNLTRAEFAKIAINSSKYKNSVALGAKISVFQDCTYTHWAAPYVKVAVSNKVITGYPDGTFKPNNNVSLEEAVTVLLRLLGYGDEDFGNTWPYGQISLAQNIGIMDNVARKIGEAITREDALKLVYNTLNSSIKGSDREYCSEIDVTLYGDVIIMATNKEDSSVSYGKVLTSAGTFKCDDYISDYVGLKGSLAVKTGGEVICFTEDRLNSVSEYIVYSVLSDSIIAYHNGAMTELKVSGGTPVYSGAEKLTFSSARSSVEIGDVIYAVMASNGSVDYLTLTRDSLEGPTVLYNYTQNWYNRFTGDSSALTVIRNGEKVDLSAVKANDVLYYSKELRTVFAYSKTVSGIYEKALPNKDTPTSVVVSGTEYQIESVEAFQKLSSAGELTFGSSVVLLLGKDGKIAGVMSSKVASDTAETVGILSQTGKKQYEKDNETYTSRYVTIILTDGTSVEYRTDNDYSSFVNSVVRVTFENDSAKLTKVNNATITGRVDAQNMKIGKYNVSNGVQILDISTTRADYAINAVSTYMPRLDGITLTNSSVLWYKINSMGEITKLILKDVTGDTALYGIISEYSEPSETSMSTTASYTIDSNGQQLRYTGGIFSNLNHSTPVKMIVSGNQIQTMSEIYAVNGKISDVNSHSITAGNVEYQLSDNVIVYRQLSVRNFAIMTLSELVETYKDYTVTAYQDKAQSLGGRIRILIVR